MIKVWSLHHYIHYDQISFVLTISDKVDRLLRNITNYDGQNIDTRVNIQAKQCFILQILHCSAMFSHSICRLNEVSSIRKCRHFMCVALLAFEKLMAADMLQSCYE